jgi:hypothetical protein
LVFCSLRRQRILFDDSVINLPRRDPHAVDGVADHVGGSLLAFWSSRHTLPCPFVRIWGTSAPRFFTMLST